MNDLFRALLRALVNQLHPRMLWLAIWPFLLALLLWGALGWFLREPLLSGLQLFLSDLAVVNWVDTGLSWAGMGGFKIWLPPLVLLALLVPVIVVTALLIVATIAMPAVIEHVSERDYRDVARTPAGAGVRMAGSLFNAFWATVVFSLGWVLTLPFWLIVPLAFLLPMFWWGWLNTRILRYDALLEHASSAERRLLAKRYRRSYFMLGMIVGLLNFVPPLFFFAPIYGALAFTHFSLHALRQLRAAPIEVEAVLVADAAIDVAPDLSPRSPN